VSAISRRSADTPKNDAGFAESREARALMRTNDRSTATASLSWPPSTVYAFWAAPPNRSVVRLGVCSAWPAFAAVRLAAGLMIGAVAPGPVETLAVPAVSASSSPSNVADTV
jgi:hypothetical protein